MLIKAYSTAEAHSIVCVAQIVEAPVSGDGATVLALSWFSMRCDRNMAATGKHPAHSSCTIINSDSDDPTTAGSDDDATSVSGVRGSNRCRAFCRTRTSEVTEQS